MNADAGEPREDESRQHALFSIPPGKEKCRLYREYHAGRDASSQSPHGLTAARPLSASPLSLEKMPRETHLCHGRAGADRYAAARASTTYMPMRAIDLPRCRIHIYFQPEHTLSMSALRHIIWPATSYHRAITCRRAIFICSILSLSTSPAGRQPRETETCRYDAPATRQITPTLLWCF